MNDITLRDATVDDAPLLAQIGVTSWRETYAGLLSEDLLDGLDGNPFHDHRYWQSVLSKPSQCQWIWIVERGSAIGLCKFGSGDTDDNGGVVDRLYLLRPAQRQGLGRRLMAAAGRLLAMHDQRPLYVWTLECNLPALAFYERLGGRRLPRRPVFEDQGQPIFEVGFCWDRPELLG
jgi:GNAT superfamily N-acetyltransferase